jgi:uncharacterized protein
MQEEIVSKISKELSLDSRSVVAVLKLLGEGATIPFIARYRKEATGSLDEVAITSIRDRSSQIQLLNERRQAIFKSLDERKLLTDELKKKIDAADTLARLEDIYLPFRPKRRTRATIARERGLEPLASKIFEGQTESFDPEKEAMEFVSEADEVADTAAALAGARDIIAEWISDDADARADLRECYQKRATLVSKLIKGKEKEAAKYRDYFDWQESSAKVPSHRILAIRRGEAEGFLSMSVRPEEDDAISLLERRFVKGETKAAEQVRLATHDAFKRLLSISMETAARVELKKQADAEATKVFAENLRELLLAPALGEKPVLAIDPGFRTGCKVVTLDAQGKLLFDTVVYPTMGADQQGEAGTVMMGLIDRFNPSAIAIGNGTASRETESFVKSLKLPRSVAVIMVNESGASIYSASAVAREEFPDKDVTVRGAVSIGRRLMDPLAELVKIDPKSIGVGQYQHDVDQSGLKQSLDDVVLSCVNSVGVEVNTASKQLLSFVSGLNSRIAGEIVKYRELMGAFKSRKELLKVPGLGPKAYEQSAGFLRIRGAENPLDSSAVHPERYSLVEQMASDLGSNIRDLISSEGARSKIDINKYVSEDVGLPTLKDIIEELSKPGRDPRDKFEVFQFMEGVEKPEDLRLGMRLPGIVTNVTAFGAFVDVGVHQDGLVHVSQIADKFVSNPAAVVKVGQRVQVRVTEVDLERNRIGLSMKSDPELDTSKSGMKGKPQGHYKTGPKRSNKGRRGGDGKGGKGGKSNDFGGFGDMLEELGL